MQKLIIKGKQELKGKISISGSKNATLPILAATILANNVRLQNVPLVKDTYTMTELLKFIGLEVKIKKNKKEILIKKLRKNIKTLAPYKLVKTMRAGVLVLGSLLSRYKKAKYHCLEAARLGHGLSTYIYLLKKLGAKIKIKNGYILAEAKRGLRGANICFPEISVGATENAILAAFKAKGKTILENCATEPEIKNLITFLNKLGAKIKIIGRKIIVKYCENVSKKINHKIIFDRIELGTYLIASALVGKKIVIDKIDTNIIKNEIDILKKMCVKIKKTKNSITVNKCKNLKKINISTKPYPGFPTDLQAQFMVLMTQAKGISKIKENIFENRFMHVPELKRMGAKIEIKNRIAFIKGPTKLTGAEVMATDLRASVSLVLAGLVADNRTIINRIYHLDRGYENLEKKLKKCKALIKRV